MMTSVSHEAHRLGPDAGADYSSLKIFLYSLEDMTVLKHLVLPADMYLGNWKTRRARRNPT